MNASIAHLAADFGPRRGGGFHGRGVGALFVGALLVSAVVVLAVMLYRSRTQTPIVAPPLPPLPGAAPASPAGNAEMILSERLARGEVSVEDFVAARAALRGEWVAPPPPADTSADAPVG